MFASHQAISLFYLSIRSVGNIRDTLLGQVYNVLGH